MQKLARLAIQRRWLVIGAWLAFIVLAQGISGALGGANYKDTFSLPHTETASVAKVLKNAGLDSQNGATGTVVLKAKTGTLQSAPAGLAPALDKLCTSGNQVSTIRTPWQAIDCTKAGATTAGDPKLLNTAKGSTTGLVNITWTSNHYDQKLFTNVFNELKNLRSDALQVEFTGNAFQNIGQSNGGVPPFAFGFIAALIILLIVFRTVAATALPLASAVAALGAGLGADRHPHPRHERVEHHPATDRADGARRGRRLRVVHRYPAPPEPAPRHERAGLHHRLDQHVRTRGAVRGLDRVHRDPRPDRARRQLLQRHGDRRRRGGRPDHGGLADACCRHCCRCSA